LERAPRFQGAAICPRCASIIARRYGESGADKLGAEESAKAKSSKNNETASSFEPPKVVERKPDTPVNDWADAEEIYD
jgi:hypothetical protein